MINILVDIYCISTIICMFSLYLDNITQNKPVSTKESLLGICPIVNTIKAIKHIYNTINPKR